MVYNRLVSIDEIYRIVTEQKPPIIYVGGKTSTGKSTFGRRLHDELGYNVIELEAVLLDVVSKQEIDEKSAFKKVFYDAEGSTEKTAFLQTTDQIISGALAMHHPLVIEGAISNADTLQRILQPAKNLYFLYFHPSDIAIYIRNLTNRFLHAQEIPYGGLPDKFWQLIDKREYAKFCKTNILTDNLKKSIRQYALLSQAASLERLDEYRHRFQDIILIEIQ